ncbi:MAG: hypothetical protein UX80_C0001G0012 [Candidatus Amesbacteria bacterium GW2011_GWA2_47_11b]|uniref:Uncharacterized protein n=3 Tax=Candidatus Amesiibacteriota TaxID=1752730 RepID=A0A0G1SKZ6_9BACT|nr:MAG: hypothetical protein UX42_C0013G0005 [Microgenomates group bacterium GW2011_GWC1_46_20]KKU58573.1 MAG: hypothetical protein UX80_C0001G0012 [Candidatus Amesbacteria bacterium GW2011_GWA2_47_11b]KKU70154.1 MAG: hypothetical protein UX92_C0004G0031 [Candidatus Amesbacteria bacterium GW2011_GWA1_47_20]KKU84665.1 MAG: hypothetical protein UY11_C0005G0039 [Candidatus Amesbacteria bacterium GW2011_GWC2_47_8]
MKTSSMQVTSAALAQSAANKAFELFQDRKFRSLADFPNLPQTEQDRIFNELVLAGLVMIMLTLEAPDLRVTEELKKDFISIKDHVGWEYIQQLAGMGIEKKYLKDWEKLIKMRYEEYALDKLQAREATMEIESKEYGLTTEKMFRITLMLPVNTVAIGCHNHICRGKTDGRDELFKIIIKWLGKFYLEVRVPLEGGKIDWKSKTKAFIKRKLGI